MKTYPGCECQLDLYGNRSYRCWVLLNFDDHSPRHTYTLEKIKNGPTVYQLMKTQWQLATA